MTSKIKSILAIVLCLAAILSVVSCGDNKPSVEFIVDGVVYSSVKTSGNESITLPANPAKEHYIFSGWYLDNGTWEQEFTADHLASKELTSDMKVYAKFVENTAPSYEISFIVDGSVYHSVATNGYETLEFPTAPKKDNHMFLGWYYSNPEGDVEFTKTSLLGTPITSDLSVYAKFGTFDDNGWTNP